MMKNAALISAAVALLVLSGCSSKEPAIDATTSSASGTSAIAPSSAVATDTNAVIAPITSASATDATASAAVGTNGSEGGLVNILFDYDKFDIREDMQAAMKNNGAQVKDKSVKLEGNCDEFGSDEYNYALGLKRANAVKTALVNDGMNPDSITMVSFGEGNPVCLEKTPECWQKNRRVEFKLP